MGKKTKRTVRGDRKMREILMRYRSLRDFRDEYLGKSQAEVAEQAGVSESAIRKLEKTGLPDKKRLWAKYLAGYDVPLSCKDLFAKLAGSAVAA